MASLKPRPESMTRSGDMGPRRPAVYRGLSQEEYLDRTARRPRQEVDPVRSAGTEASSGMVSPKTSSRIPQSSSLRRPSDSRTERPLLNPQPQAYGSMGAANPGRSFSSTAMGPQSTPPSTRSVSTGTKQPRNVLRRKHSGLGQEGASQPNDPRNYTIRTDSSSSDPRSLRSLEVPSPATYDRGLTESPMEISIAQKVELPTTTAHTVMIYPELDRYQHVSPPKSSSEGSRFEVPFRLATYDLSPPTPLFSGTGSQVSGLSGSPSTRWSESPGPGPYSRDTTPTSMSSQSPGIAAPTRFPNPRVVRQATEPIPSTRPPVTRRRGSLPTEDDTGSNDPQGLAAVRESLTSSSSGSTVRAGEKERRKKKRLSPLPPSPPPRKSSQKFKKSQDEEEESPTKPSKSAKSSKESVAQPQQRKVGSSSTKVTSPQPAPARPQPQSQPRPVDSPRATPPVRPSRDGTPDFQSQFGFQMPIVHSNLSASSLTDRRQSMTVPQAPHHPGLLNRPNTPSYLSEGPQPAATVRRVPAAREPTPAPGSTNLGDAAPATSVTAPGRSIRTPSPSIGGFKSRFPLFGRKTTKTAADASQPDSKKEKEKPATRKGPAAGTGHEGYGRLGATRRRSSSGSTMAAPRGLSGTGTGIWAGTMSSQESLSSNMSMSHDPFLLERMAPVIIAGGEVIENRNTNGAELSRTESNQSLPHYTHTSRPVPESRNGSSASLSSRDGPRTTLWPSPFSPAEGHNKTESAAPVPLGNHTTIRGSSQSRIRRPSDSSDSEAPAMRSTLAFRRSMQRLKTGGGDQLTQPRVPKPIVTTAPRLDVISPSMTSLDTSVMSDDSMFDPLGPPIRPGDRSRKGSDASFVGTGVGVASGVPILAPPKKLTKPRARSPRKWNFFGRSQSQPATVKKTTTEQQPPKPTVTAAVKTTTAVPAKPVAFYAIIDSSEQEDVDPVDLEEILREARGLDAAGSSAQEARERRPSAGGRRPSTGGDGQADTAPLRKVQAQIGARRAVTSPVKPTQREREPKAAKPSSVIKQTPSQAPSPLPPPTRPTVATGTGTARPSRLPQVGRIPKVVSVRPEQTSPKSFSRPFNRISVQLPSSHIGIDFQDPESLAKGPTPPKPSTPEPQARDGLGIRPTAANVTAPATTSAVITQQSDLPGDLSPDTTAIRVGVGREFLSFSPRKNSQCTVTTTTSTSSSGLLSYADATAVVPPPNAPLVEDEIWDEYNDLLGAGDESNLKMGLPPQPPSAGSSAGKPFHLEIYRSRLGGGSAGDSGKGGKSGIEEPLESPTIGPPQMQSLMQSLDRAMRPEPEPESVPLVLKDEQETKEAPASSVYSVDMMAEVKDLLLGMETGADQPPPTPFSVSEFVGEYTERNNSADSGKQMEPTTATKPLVIKRGSSSPRHSTRRSDASSSSQGSLEDSTSPLSQVNLRVGSMTVSKWLTFGHVLFSPLRDELTMACPSSTLERPSIMVIDGLGNDDWSFYAAETYPTATFFNLSPRAPIVLPESSTNQSNSSSSTSSTTSPSSYPLTPPNHHQVQHLSPLSRVPFSPHSFAAVVYRFPIAAPEAHYRAVIAEAHRVLRPGGFIELAVLDLDLNNMGNRCRRAVRRLRERLHRDAPDTCLGSTSDLVLRLLGARGFADVKVCRVGVPVASAITRSEGVVPAEVDKGKEGEKGTKTKTRTRKRDDRSLAEMMSDEGAVADESITKMVAKVGRWWYTKCYEDAGAGSGSGPGGPQKSMWNDRALLAECEEWGTSLKLMVCHAMVPEDGKPRVASI